MSDHIEHACTRCGSLLHHADAGSCDRRFYVSELGMVRDDLSASRRESAALSAMVARLRGALERIISTDTHGKNVPDELGAMRPTGTDFCGRCNRNSFHPHADDCPIARIDAALALTPATAGAEYQALVDLAKRLCCDIANDAHCLDSGSLRADVIIYRSYGYARELADATKFDGPKTLHEFEAAARAVLDRAPGKEKR